MGEVAIGGSKSKFHTYDAIAVLGSLRSNEL
jgi:hypothetical protein